jgi:transposase
MKLSLVEKRELRHLARHGEPGYLRIKALALLNLERGKGIAEIAEMLGVTRQSLWSWRCRWEKQGIAGLLVATGRGRKAKADPEEIADHIRRSPREFGLSQSRWSLTALARVVPSLHGFTPFGVQKAVQRAGYRYKRGQPYLHSPDPAYGEKKGLWSKR